MIGRIDRLPALTSEAGIGFACQTYGWQMSIDRYRGQVGRIAKTVRDAGYPALEPEVVMLGDGWSTDGLARELAAHDLTLAALCLVEDWRQPVESDAERMAADRAIGAVAAMPGAVLNLCQMPGSDRSDLVERQRAAIACINAIGVRAADRGVRAVFHPNSPDGSVFRAADDYARLLDGMAPEVGFTPDLGHIAKGGMDPVHLVRTYGERVEHVHIKDVDERGAWAETGDGVVDIVATCRALAAARYRGWIVMEDESPQAARDPDAAAVRNARYIRERLLPVINGRTTP